LVLGAFPILPEWEKLLRANQRASTELQALKMGLKTKLGGAQEVRRPNEKCYLHLTEIITIV
jgi:hypothetical protein